MLPNRWRLAALAILVSTAGCSSNVPPSPPVPEAAPASAPGDAPRQAPQGERLLVRRAELELSAHQPDSLAPRVAEIIRVAGGFVASSVVEEGHRLRMSLRVPSPALEPTLAAISALAEVERREMSAVDVTEQVFDLEARLRNTTAVRDRLRQHLQRAAGVGDIIEVERELGRVQAEVEVLEGRLKRIREEAALSQITLEVHQKRILGPLGKLLEGIVWFISKLFVIR
ncbi:MAG TPA: DUF4349 domain-containing protein [Longimicrobium sp.]